MIEYYRFLGTKEYAEEFLNGSLYMNSMGYFWENGFEGQRDFAEGSLVTMNPSQTPFPEDLKGVIKGNIVTRAVGYRYCNICSFTRLVVNHKQKYVIRFNPKMRDFGKYVVRIKNFDEFLKRIISATRVNKDIAIGGPVRYVEPSNEIELNCFCKADVFNWQFEWRVAYLHDIEELKKDAKSERLLQKQFEGKKFVLNIGNIADICELYSANDMWNDQLKGIYPDYTIYETPLQKGEFSDEEMRELLAEVNYGFGVNVNNEFEFQQIVQSILNYNITLFRI